MDDTAKTEIKVKSFSVARTTNCEGDKMATSAITSNPANEKYNTLCHIRHEVVKLARQISSGNVSQELLSELRATLEAESRAKEEFYEKVREGGFVR